jgi:hypothetical protein
LLVGERINQNPRLWNHEGCFNEYNPNTFVEIDEKGGTCSDPRLPAKQADMEIHVGT